MRISRLYPSVLVLMLAFAVLPQGADAAGLGSLLTARQIMTGNLTNGLLVVNSSSPGSPVGPIGVKNIGNSPINVHLSLDNVLSGKTALSDTDFSLLPNQTKSVNFIVFIIQPAYYPGSIGVSFSTPGQVGTSSLSSDLYILALGQASPNPPDVAALLNSVHPSTITTNGTVSNMTSGGGGGNYTALQAQIDALTQRVSQLESRMGFFETLMNTMINGVCSIYAFPFCPPGSTGTTTPGNGGNTTQQCQNECTISQNICDGSTSRRICGNFDSDQCLEYSPPLPCGSGQACQNGQCVTQECTTQTVCSMQSCGPINSYSACKTTPGCSWSFFQSKCTGQRNVCSLQQVCH